MGGSGEIYCPSQGMTRRELLSVTATASTVVLVGCAATGPLPAEIVDTHAHFYDPTRPQGVPWPPKDDPVLYCPIYPEEFKKLARPHGVTGTVVVEASPWREDNQWVLDLAAGDPFLLGLVGHLLPGDPDFVAQLRRDRPALPRSACQRGPPEVLAKIGLTEG